MSRLVIPKGRSQFILILTTLTLICLLFNMEDKSHSRNTFKSCSETGKCKVQIILIMLTILWVSLGMIQNWNSDEFIDKIVNTNDTK